MARESKICRSNEADLKEHCGPISQGIRTYSCFDTESQTSTSAISHSSLKNYDVEKFEIAETTISRRAASPELNPRHRISISSKMPIQRRSKSTSPIRRGNLPLKESNVSGGKYAAENSGYFDSFIDNNCDPFPSPSASKTIFEQSAPDDAECGLHSSSEYRKTIEISGAILPPFLHMMNDLSIQSNPELTRCADKRTSDDVYTQLDIPKRKFEGTRRNIFPDVDSNDAADEACDETQKSPEKACKKLAMISAEHEQISHFPGTDSTDRKASAGNSRDEHISRELTRSRHTSYDQINSQQSISSCIIAKPVETGLLRGDISTICDTKSLSLPPPKRSVHWTGSQHGGSVRIEDDNARSHHSLA